VRAVVRYADANAAFPASSEVFVFPWSSLVLLEVAIFVAVIGALSLRKKAKARTWCSKGMVLSI